MYHGEVEVPTQDISRFLAVAEQFQVRGLVEDVPKVWFGLNGFMSFSLLSFYENQIKDVQRGGRCKGSILIIF